MWSVTHGTVPDRTPYGACRAGWDTVGRSGADPKGAQRMRPKRLRACRCAGLQARVLARACASVSTCERSSACALARARLRALREEPAVGSAAAVTRCAQLPRASRTATAHEATLQRQSARASRRTAAAPLQHGATWRNVAQHVAKLDSLNAPPMLFPALLSRPQHTLLPLSLPPSGIECVPSVSRQRYPWGSARAEAATCCCRCGSM